MGLLLFSSGQDSTCEFFFTLLQKQKNHIVLLTMNHEAQANNFLTLSHALCLTYFFQTRGLVILFKRPFFELGEEELRFFRYVSIVRIQHYYNFLFFSSGHTKSDLLETYFLNWVRTFYSPDKNITFNSKILVQKSYFSHKLNKKIQQKNKELDWKKKHKKKETVIMNFSGEKKVKTLYSRPLKQYSRKAISTLVEIKSLYLFIDFTNFDFTIMRNKIRRHILLYFDCFFFQNWNLFKEKNRRFKVFLLFSFVFSFSLQKKIFVRNFSEFSFFYSSKNILILKKIFLNLRRTKQCIYLCDGSTPSIIFSKMDFLFLL